MDEFKEKGVGSKAWYLREIKNNPDRRGFSWMRLETRGAPQFDVLKTAMQILVHQRYIDPIGKPDKRGSTYHKLTTLGFRYLEEHKEELDPITIDTDEAYNVLQTAVGKRYRKGRRFIPRSEVPEDILKRIDGDPEKAPANEPQLIGKQFPVKKGTDPNFTFEEPIAEDDRQSRYAVKKPASDPKVFHMDEKGEEVDVKPLSVPDDFLTAPLVDANGPGKIEPVVGVQKWPGNNGQLKPVKLSKLEYGDVPAELSFEEKFRKILTEILLEKFTDQVSAKEILERMEKNG